MFTFPNELCCLILDKLFNLSKFGFLVRTKGMLSKNCKWKPYWGVLSGLTSIEERRKQTLIEQECYLFFSHSKCQPPTRPRVALQSAGIRAGGPRLYTLSLISHWMWQLLRSEVTLSEAALFSRRQVLNRNSVEICQHQQLQQQGNSTDALEWGIWGCHQCIYQ